MPPPGGSARTSLALQDAVSAAWLDRPAAQPTRWVVDVVGVFDYLPPTRFLLEERRAVADDRQFRVAPANGTMDSACIPPTDHPYRSRSTQGNAPSLPRSRQVAPRVPGDAAPRTAPPSRPVSGNVPRRRLERSF